MDAAIVKTIFSVTGLHVKDFLKTDWEKGPCLLQKKKHYLSYNSFVLLPVSR